MLVILTIFFRLYVDGIRIGARYIKSLAELMRNSLPRDATPVERRRLETVLRRAAHVDAVLNERDRVSKARVRQPFVDFGSAFGALHTALVAASEIPESASDRGARATAILSTLFPDGLSFVAFDARAAWAEGDRRVQRIADEGLTDEIIALSGPDFLAGAIAATTTLGNAIGVGTPAREMPSTTALQEAVSAFSRSVGAYCRALAASVEEDDADSHERFRKAVAPIDEFRALGRANEVDETEPTEPADEPPATPPAASDPDSPFIDP